MRASAFDFRHGLRLLRRYPLTSIIAVATLALGIGANAAIFSVVDAVLVQQLPFPDPDRLVMVWEKRPREGVLTNSVAPADFLDWRRRNDVFQHIAALSVTTATLTGDGEPIQVGGGAVSWSFFDVLGVKPAMGRTFGPNDEVVGQHRNVVITHGFWKQRFGADPAIVGRSIMLNGGPFEVIGVLPERFRFVDATLDIWAPLPLEVPGGEPPARTWHSLDVYARLKPDVTLAQALDRMDQLGRQIETENPNTNTGHGAHVMPARDHYVGDVKTSLLLMSAGVGLVLLIACVNIANLLLVRAAARRREMAVRAALGASRARLVVQSLTESLGLSAIGGIAGIGVAWLAIRALPVILPERMSVVGIDDLSIDVRVLGFAAVLAVLTGLLFGLLPALFASRPRAADALAQGGRGPTGVRRGSRLTLVIGEVALATLTLVGAGLVIRSFAGILSTPLGFDPDGRLTMRVVASGPRYRTPDPRRLALDQIEQSLAAIPGVTTVGAIDMPPLSGLNARQGMTIEGREVRPDDPPTRMHPRVVTPGYFAAMGIDIKQGRAFLPQDDAAARPVVVISEMAARQFWPDRDPVGLRVRYNGEEIWRTVVGVAADVRHWGRAADSNPMIYRPQAQIGVGSLTFVMATAGDRVALTAPARARIAGVDPNLPMTRVRTLDALASESVRSERALMVLMSAFAALALLLAVIGIYGVMAQLVVVRVPEIGVRMTLGARPLDVLRSFLVDGFWQAAAGLTIGLVAGVYMMKLAGTLLVGVRPWDPVTLTGVAVVLLAAALSACLIPARRAMRIDPATALRQG